MYACIYTVDIHIGVLACTCRGLSTHLLCLPASSPLTCITAFLLAHRDVGSRSAASTRCCCCCHKPSCFCRMWLPYVCFAVCFAVRPRHACPVLLFGCLAASWCLCLNLSCACLCLFPFQLPHAVSPPATSRHTTHAFPLWLAITRFSYQRPGLLLSGLGVVLAGWSVVCSGLWAGFARVARCMHCLQYGIRRAGVCLL